MAKKIVPLAPAGRREARFQRWIGFQDDPGDPERKGMSGLAPTTFFGRRGTTRTTETTRLDDGRA